MSRIDLGRASTADRRKRQFAPGARQPAELRHNLEHRTVAIGASGVRGSVEVTAGIEGKGPRGTASVLAVEAGQQSLGPVPAAIRCQLKHNTVVIFAAVAGRPVKIANCIEHQRGERLPPVVRSSEAVQYRLIPTPNAGRQLEDCTPAKAAALRSAIEIASGIKD